jgi:hypothetical protein
MGYYTYYTMEAKDAKTGAHLDDALEAKICQRLYEISNGAIIDDDSFYGCLGDCLKWYDHHDNMLDLSKEFPDVIFMLEGEGEERDDNWRLYVHNGEWEETHATIVWNAPGCEKFRSFYW